MPRILELVLIMDVEDISGGFFEEQFTFWRFRVAKRLLVPFLVILAAKIAGAFIVYYLMNVQASGSFWTDPNRVFNWEQNAVFLENANRAPSWSYTFVGWDSAWYLSIMTHGYGFTPNSYGFSPGLPFFSTVFNLFFQNPLVSIALCAFFFGVLWVPFYQLVAEKYISKKAALGSTFLFAFSPYVFLFTTVAYSEGLFLFFTLSAWYFFIKGKKGIASGFAAISTLARIAGVVLVLPMMMVSLREKGVRRIRRVAFSLSPVLALLFWLVYCQITANDFLAIAHVTEWESLYTFRALLFTLPQQGFSVFQVALQNGALPSNWLLPFAIVGALVIPPFLIYKAFRTMKPLALYALFCYVWVLIVGALVSLPRYFSVLFPLWIALTAGLSMNKKSAVLLGVTSAISFVVSLSLWVDFLNGRFVA